MGDILFDVFRYAVLVGFVGGLALILFGIATTVVRAYVYESRGYKVTHPGLLAEFFGDGRPLVEVPEGFVSDRKWLDFGLRFARPDDAWPTCPVCGAPRR